MQQKNKYSTVAYYANIFYKEKFLKAIRLIRLNKLLTAGYLLACYFRKKQTGNKFLCDVVSQLFWTNGSEIKTTSVK